MTAIWVVERTASPRFPYRVSIEQKPRRDGTGTYEQVFFRTESGIRAQPW